MKPKTNEVTWSQLDKETQNLIISRLESGDDRQQIAAEFNLHYASFSRTMRRIRAKQKRQEQKQTQKNAADAEGVDIASRVSGLTVIEPYFQKDINMHLYGEIGLGSNPDERVMFLNINRPVSILYFSDAHFPYHDQDSVEVFLRACRRIPHEIIVNGGDTLDLYGLSKYGKDPNKVLVNNLKKERAVFREFAERLNEASPYSEKLNIFGNHMYRYIIWLHENPSIMAMEEMQIDAIMGLSNLKWHVNVREVLFNANYTNLDFPDPELVFQHGSTVKKHAGTSSKTESENMGYVSSASAHVHRLAVTYKKTLRSQILMAEAGTLRNLRPGYVARPDWQNGFMSMTFVPGLATFCNPILIYNGQAYYEGKKL